MDSTSLTQLISKPIASSWVPSDDCQQAAESVGEKWRSIKQFIMRYVPVLSNNTRDATYVTVNPYFLSIPSVTTAGIMQQGDIMGSPLNWMAFMYLFQRGSMNFGLANVLDPANNVSIFMANTPDPIGTSFTCWGTTFTPLTNAGGNHASVYGDTQYPSGGFIATDLNTGLATAKVPYYCPQKASVIVNINAGGTVKDNNTPSSMPLSRLSIYALSDQASTVYFRAAGDDYQLSYFLGAPPIYVSNT
jgi:hypothetical protein